MTTLTIELPEMLITEMNNRRVSDELLHSLIIKAIEDWLDTGQEIPLDVRPVTAEEDIKLTMAELWAELDEINAQEPLELELPQRIDRPNPLLEMPDDFFV